MSAAAELLQRPTEIRLLVPGMPVSINQAWHTVMLRPKGQPPRASVAMTQEGKDYQARIGHLVDRVRPEHWDRTNEYSVTCEYYFDSMRPDVDGPGKLILDALGEFEAKAGKSIITFDGLYKNDRQVWEFVQRRAGVDPKNPRTEITVRLLRPWKPQQAVLL